MRKVLTGIASAGALLLTAAAPAAAAPPAAACANMERHGTAVAHAKVPEGNHRAHMSIPHHCEGY